MERADFTATERGLHATLDALADELSVAERQEVVEFIEVGEYGIALETLCALLVEERKMIPAAVFAQLVALADAMGVRASTITHDLHKRVIGE